MRTVLDNSEGLCYNTHILKETTCTLEERMITVYTYQGQSVATYEQLVPVLQAKNSKQLSNTYDRNKQQFNEGQDIFVMKGESLSQFRSQNQLGKISILHLFSRNGAYKLASIRKLDSSRINEAYGVTAAKEEVQSVESTINSETQATASYNCFEIVKGTLQLSKKVGVPVKEILKENKQLKEEKSKLIDLAASQQNTINMLVGSLVGQLEKE